MARTVQFLVLLLIAVAVECYGGHRYYHSGRFHGRYPSRYDYSHHRGRHDSSPHDAKHQKHVMSLINKNSNRPESQPLSNIPGVTNSPARAVPYSDQVDHSEPVTGANNETPSGTVSTPVIDPAPNSKPNLDLTGTVNNDKPDDVADALSSSEEEPNNDDNGTLNVDGLSPGEDNAGNGNVDGGQSTSDSNEEPNGDGTINVDGVSPGVDEDKANLSIDGNLPNNDLGKPDDTLHVHGLSSDEDNSRPDNHDDNDAKDAGNIDVDGIDTDDEGKPGKDAGNINVDGLSPGGDDNSSDNGDNTIDVNGLSPNGEGHGSKDMGLYPNGDRHNHDDNNFNANDLSPGGVDVHGQGNTGGLPNVNLGDGSAGAHIGLPDLSGHISDGLHVPNPDMSGHISGGLHVQNPDMSGHISGGLHVPNPDMSGHISGGLHVPNPDISGHISGGLHIPNPEISGHVHGHGALEPGNRPGVSGNVFGNGGFQNRPGIHGHFPNNGGFKPEHRPGHSNEIDNGKLEPGNWPDESGDFIDNDGLEQRPTESGEINIDGEDPEYRPNYPISPGNDILPNPNEHELPNKRPHGRPDKVDKDAEGKKNLIPVLLPGGGHIFVHPSVLGHMPSYMIVMINGQPTLIQNPGLVHGGVHGAQNIDLSKLGLGNGLGIGGIHGVLPSWLHLGGIGGGNGGYGMLPNIQQPIWIGSQYPIGNGGGGSYIVSNDDSVPIPMPRPIPVPVPRPIPVPIPRPIPTPEAVIPTPIPQPVDPGFNQPAIQYPWPSQWNIHPAHPNINVSQPLPLMPNLGSNFDWQSFIDMLLNLGSKLQKPEPYPQPLPFPYPQPYPYPYPQPNYPSKQPYPYPPYQYPVYPVPTPIPTGPSKDVGDDSSKITPEPIEPTPKPTGPGKNVGDDSFKDTTEPTEPIFPGVDIMPTPKPVPTPQPKPEEPERKPATVPTLEPETIPTPRPELIPTPLPEINEPQRKPDPVPTPQPLPLPIPTPMPELEPKPEEPEREPVPLPTPHPELVPTPKPEETQLPEFQTPLPDISLPTPGPEISMPKPQPKPVEPRPVIPVPDTVIPLPHPHPGPELPPFEPTPPPPPVPTPWPQPTYPGTWPVPTYPDPWSQYPTPKPQPLPTPDLGDKKDQATHKPRYPEIKFPGINIPSINIPIPIPKPSHNGKSKPGKTGLDSGLIDILNVLLKFPNRNSKPPKNIEPLIKLLLAILKPGGKNQEMMLPNLSQGGLGGADLASLSQLLLHILQGHNNEPNFNVLVEPGIDESTRSNLIMLLNLLASNLANTYPGMGYYQQENPLLYFLGHFPCDHPSFSGISGLQSSKVWQLLANMYGHKLGRSEFRLERSAEETDDKPAAAENKVAADNKIKQ